jgi:drug/metabolite transporter (DMT)-like permease
MILLNLAAWAALCLVYVLVINKQDMPYDSTIPLVVTGYLVANFLFFNMMLKSHRKNPKRFVSSFTGVISLKLFGTTFFLLLYMFFNREDFLPVVVATVVSYLTFTVVLISSVLKAFKE